MGAVGSGTHSSGATSASRKHHTFCLMDAISSRESMVFWYCRKLSISYQVGSRGKGRGLGGAAGVDKGGSPKPYFGLVRAISSLPQRSGRGGAAAVSGDDVFKRGTKNWGCKKDKMEEKKTLFPTRHSLGRASRPCPSPLSSVRAGGGRQGGRGRRAIHTKPVDVAGWMFPRLLRARSAFLNRYILRR